MRHPSKNHIRGPDSMHRLTDMCSASTTGGATASLGTSVRAFTTTALATIPAGGVPTGPLTGTA